MRISRATVRRSTIAVWTFMFWTVTGSIETTGPSFMAPRLGRRLTEPSTSSA